MELPDRAASSVTPGVMPVVRRTLSKKDKLRFKSEFDYVRASGRKAVGKSMLAVVAPPPDALLKCGVVCGRKFSTLAVTRNRARRLLWESFRLLKPETAPCRMVLIPRRSIMGMKRQAVTGELAQLLFQLGVLDRCSAVSPPEC